jgi:hypothetical protein
MLVPFVIVSSIVYSDRKFNLASLAELNAGKWGFSVVADMRAEQLAELILWRIDYGQR